MKAVITGGTKGIGRAIADRLSANGHEIYVCSRHQADLEAMQKAYNAAGRVCHIFRADLERREEITDFGNQILDTWDTIDILVNNAGIFLPGKVTEEEEGRLESMLSINLLSGYHLTRQLLHALKKSPRAYIVNICSVASTMAYPDGGSYSISKWAQLGWTKALRKELTESNIAVTAIMPGATWSASWEGVDLPESRLMPASDIAELVDCLLRLSKSAVVEEIVLRPQLGDL